MSYFKILYEGTASEYKIYYKDKQLTIIHREDGPAIEWHNGFKSYYLNGVSYYKNDFCKELARIRFGDFV